MLRDRESSGRLDTMLIPPPKHKCTLSLLEKRQAELQAVLTGNCPNQTRATKHASFPLILETWGVRPSLDRL